jgi:hypothetical protein
VKYLFTYRGISSPVSKKQKSVIYIYSTTFEETGFIPRFSASPDFDRVLLTNQKRITPGTHY